MFDIVLNPVAAIAAAKKNKDMGKTFVLLLIASFVSAVSMLFFMRFNSSSLLTALLTLIGAFIGALIFAFLLKKFFWIVGKHSDYYSALTMITYGFFAMSWGYLVGSILGLIPAVGIVLSTLVILFMFVMSTAIMFKSGMVFFETDMITLVVAVAVVWIALFSAYTFSTLQVLVGGWDVITGGALGPGGLAY